MTLHGEISARWALYGGAPSDKLSPSTAPRAPMFEAGEPAYAGRLSGESVSPARFGNNLAHAVSRAGIVDEMWLSWRVLNRFNGEA